MPKLRWFLYWEQRLILVAHVHPISLYNCPCVAFAEMYDRYDIFEEDTFLVSHLTSVEHLIKQSCHLADGNP